MWFECAEKKTQPRRAGRAAGRGAFFGRVNFFLCEFLCLDFYDLDLLF
jgi:hypothetical protein